MKTNEPIRFLRLKQVLQLIPVSKTTWWNGVREGTFPQPIKLGPRTTVWLQHEILDYMHDKVQNEK